MNNSVSESRDSGGVPPISPSERKKVADLLARIDPAKPESVLQFGSSVQATVAQFQDRVMSHVQAKDNRHVLIALDRLLGQLKSLDTTPNLRFSIVRWVRALRSRTSWMEQCLADYQSVGQKVDKQIDELNENRKQMLSDVEVFRKLYDQNLVHLCNVTLRLRALESKLKHLQEKVRPKIAKKAESYRDPSSELQLEDLSYQVAGLERRMRDLILTRDICIQCAGQIRLVQFDRQALAERIVDLVMNVVPLWKTQVSIALAKNRQKETLKLQQRILQATTQVLKRNAAMLKSGREDSARDAKMRAGVRLTDEFDEEPRSTAEAPAALPASDAPQPRPRPASPAVTHMKPLPDGLDH